MIKTGLKWGNISIQTFKMLGKEGEDSHWDWNANYAEHGMAYFIYHI